MDKWFRQVALNILSYHRKSLNPKRGLTRYKYSDGVFCMKQHKVLAHKHRNKQQGRLNCSFFLNTKYIFYYLMVFLENFKQYQCSESTLIFINVAIELFNSLMMCKITKELANTYT